MSLAEETRLLQKIPMFANLEESHLKLIAFTSERVQYNAGDVLFNEGDTGDCAYIVISGKIDILIASGNKNIVVATLHANDMLGEIALLCDVPRTATARSSENAEALVLEKELFFNVLKEFPDISIEIMRTLALRIENMNKRFSKIQKN